jgi:hypothetical protein
VLGSCMGLSAYFAPTLAGKVHSEIAAIDFCFKM